MAGAPTSEVFLLLDRDLLLEGHAQLRRYHWPRMKPMIRHDRSDDPFEFQTPRKFTVKSDAKLFNSSLIKSQSVLLVNLLQSSEQRQTEEVRIRGVPKTLRCPRNSTIPG